LKRDRKAQRETNKASGVLERVARNARKTVRLFKLTIVSISTENVMSSVRQAYQEAAVIIITVIGLSDIRHRF
jgi:nucleoside-triphosphatase THEP1